MSSLFPPFTSISTLKKETPEEAKLRCETELEFVQCLANPDYLHFLAQSNYFSIPEFVNYLHYLQYWKQPHYAKLLLYPQCLYFLDLLQQPKFRHVLNNKETVEWIKQRQLAHWYTYRHQDLVVIPSNVLEGLKTQST